MVPKQQCAVVTILQVSTPVTLPQYLCPCFGAAGNTHLSMVPLPEVQQEQSKQGGEYGIGTHSCC